MVCPPIRRNWSGIATVRFNLPVAAGKNARTRLDDLSSDSTPLRGSAGPDQQDANGGSSRADLRTPFANCPLAGASLPDRRHKGSSPNQGRTESEGDRASFPM